ncbi:MAG: primosomal protein N' [Clostridia bacterium]|nr:primosomal protein N' [Clostridia bacterium]
MSGEYIKVCILNAPYHADLEYTYFVPCELRENIEKGTAIVVPFGFSDRKTTAIVVSENAECESVGIIKQVVSVLSGYFKLSAEMLELCRFMKRQTLCTIGEAVKCIIPSFAISKTREIYTCVEGDESKIPDGLRELYGYISSSDGVDVQRLENKFENAQAGIRRLVRLGLVEKTTRVEEKDKSKYETRVVLTVDRETGADIAQGNNEIRLRGKKQVEVIKLLCEYGELEDKEIYSLTGAVRSTLDALEKKGLIEYRKIELSRNPYAIKKTDREEIVLSEGQEKAFETLKELYYDKEPKGALLYGITGSGKTSVIKKMIDEAIQDGRGVIVLVPEISLTPQTVEIFCGFYGERVAVIHSNLSQGERFDTYKKIMDGKADIVIGTRSAVFAPVKNLGMIVIDEEQEHTYKSDTSPKYLAHDIARFRCAKAGGLMLLASATPSLNSYYKAMSGIYTLVKLTQRYGDARLPDVIITDMRKERVRGNMSAYGAKLSEYLERTVNDGKQAILFLNRRGYHSTVGCMDCGKTIECPNCSVALTYHSYRKIEDGEDVESTQRIMERSGVLKCHYCGYRTPVPSKCKECGAKSFSYVGIGTQKAEQDLTQLIEGVKTLRLDADTTTSKSSYERILGDFKGKKAEVLIGTQMVTKGHDFPKVTLVGVLMADTMLYTSDYRASERTFSMLTQVIGRAGRAKDHGVAIIQTNSPNDQTIELSAKQDYESFYQNEIQIRKAYQFPPFCDLALITVTSPDEDSLNKVAGEMINRLEKEVNRIKAPALAYGPFEAPIYRTNGRYRKRILVKCRLNNQLREIFSDIYIDFLRGNGKCTVSIDFNPSSI